MKKLFKLTHDLCMQRCRVLMLLSVILLWAQRSDAQIKFEMENSVNLTLTCDTLIRDGVLYRFYSTTAVVEMGAGEFPVRLILYGGYFIAEKIIDPDVKEVRLYSSFTTDNSHINPEKKDDFTISFDDKPVYNTDGKTTFTFYVKNFSENLFKNTKVESVKAWDKISLENMRGMFYGNTSLKRVDLSNFDTSKVKDMSSMFDGCTNLESIEFGDFNTENVESMSYMFNKCSSLPSLDLSSFNTKKVKSMYQMFAYCDKLRRIFVGDNWNTDTPTSHSWMFRDDYSLIGGLGTVYDGDVTDKSYAHIDGGDDDPGYLCDKRTFVEPSEQGYAVFDEESGTLTFKYGEKPEGDNVYETDNTRYVLPWKNSQFKKKILKVVFDESYTSARPRSTKDWFSGAESLTEIVGLKNLNTSKVGYMNGMFSGCKGISSLDLTGFNTENVASISGMFYSCSGLTKLDLSSFNTSNVTDMSKLFYFCSNLEKVYVSDQWTTAKVTDGNGVFGCCSNIVGSRGSKYDFNENNDYIYARIDGGADAPGFFWPIESLYDTNCGYAVFDSETATLTFKYGEKPEGDNVYEVDQTNYDIHPAWDCSLLKTVVFDPSFAQARPSSTSYWFRGAAGLAIIKGIEYLNTADVYSMNNMFSGCTSLGILDLSTFDTSSVTDMQEMFYDCCTLASLDLSNFDTKRVTNMLFMFKGCSALTSIYTSGNWNLDNVEDSYMMFSDCKKLIGGKGTVYDESYTDHTYARIDGGTSAPGYFKTEKTLGQIEPYAIYSEKALLFYYDGYKTDRGGCEITSQDWIDYDYGISCIVFDDSFAEYTGLTNTAYFFASLRNIQSVIGFENFCTENVTDMSGMFENCNLSLFDLTSLNTSKVENMSSMFYGCSNIAEADLSHFDTSNVTDMSYMFYGCSNLAEVDLSHFDTSNVWTMNSMFENCSALKTIYNDDAWTYSYSDYMFFGCVSLKGAISYDAEKTDVTYANPTNGYFTSKNNPVTVLSGDVNGDGNITVADAVGIISYILGDAPDGFIEAAADVNGDTAITVADATKVLDMIGQ